MRMQIYLINYWEPFDASIGGRDSRFYAGPESQDRTLRSEIEMRASGKRAEGISQVADEIEKDFLARQGFLRLTGIEVKHDQFGPIREIPAWYKGIIPEQNIVTVEVTDPPQND